jgi:hypothetical protein
MKEVNTDIYKQEERIRDLEIRMERVEMITKDVPALRDTVLQMVHKLDNFINRYENDKKEIEKKSGKKISWINIIIAIMGLYLMAMQTYSMFGGIK